MRVSKRKVGLLYMLLRRRLGSLFGTTHVDQVLAKSERYGSRVSSIKDRVALLKRSPVSLVNLCVIGSCSLLPGCGHARSSIPVAGGVPRRCFEPRDSVFPSVGPNAMHGPRLSPLLISVMIAALLYLAFGTANYELVLNPGFEENGDSLHLINSGIVVPPHWDTIGSMLLHQNDATYSCYSGMYCEYVQEASFCSFLLRQTFLTPIVPFVALQTVLLVSKLLR